MLLFEELAALHNMLQSSQQLKSQAEEVLGTLN